MLAAVASHKGRATAVGESSYSHVEHIVGEPFSAVRDVFDLSWVWADMVNDGVSYDIGFLGQNLVLKTLEAFLVVASLRFLEFHELSDVVGLTSHASCLDLFVLK